MIPSDLHFTFPQGIYLFPVALLIGLLLWRVTTYRKQLLERLFHRNAIHAIHVARSKENIWGKAAASVLLWIFAVLALMQPEGNGRYLLESGVKGGKAGAKQEEAIAKRKAHDVIFLIDASASMEVNDTRTGESRLEYAKEIVDEMVSRLRGESAALYAFTSDTTRLSPPTMDYLFVRLVLRDMEINEGDLTGTNVLEALSDIREEYFSVETPALKTLVILTDGGDTQLEGMQGEARRSQIEALLSVIPSAKNHQLRVFTIGMGTEQGKPVPGVEDKGKPVVSSLDEELLQALSKKGRGAYYFANQWTAPGLAEDIISKIGEEKAPLKEFASVRSSGVAKGKDDLVYDQFFQFPLSVAIALLLWILFSPESRVRQ